MLLLFMKAYIIVLCFLWENTVHSKNIRNIEEEIGNYSWSRRNKEFCWGHDIKAGSWINYSGKQTFQAEGAVCTKTEISIAVWWCVCSRCIHVYGAGNVGREWNKGLLFVQSRLDMKLSLWFPTVFQEPFQAPGGESEWGFGTLIHMSIRVNLHIL